jgi:magnesium-transporting ATPase (P-type)
MTGDGVNDAPALKKAEVGIAVSNATDVAKASASLVLTNPGLTDILEAIKSSRQIYQRMLTYTLNKIIRTLTICVLLGIGLIITNNFIISQLLIVILLFANDFATMSISTDRVSFSPKPDKWDIKKLTFLGGVFAVFTLVLSFCILFTGNNVFHLSILELRTLIFLTLVFTGQATVYLVRERKHFWHSMPSVWMIASSLLVLAIVSIMATNGFLMTAISANLVFGLLAVIAVYFVFLDFIKVRIFKFAELHSEDKTGLKPEAMPRPDAKIESNPENTTTPKCEEKAESKPEVNSKTEAKTENKTESKSENTTSDLKPQIAKRAYELYEKRGRQDGHADEDWSQAEREIRKEKDKTQEQKK